MMTRSSSIRNTPHGLALESDWSLPSQEKEIFQLAAIRVSLKDFAEVGSFERLVIPILNPVLSDLAVELTGITRERLGKEGVSFQQALGSFYDFTEQGSLPVICMNGDSAVFRKNCAISGITFPFVNNFHRLRPFVEAAGIDMRLNSSGTLHALTDTPLEGHVHNALHDTRSMALFLGYMQRQGLFTGLAQLPNALPGRDPRAVQVHQLPHP
jgi:inhibitor of KinA sporulation pathway (predicted exonuclease)